MTTPPPAGGFPPRKYFTACGEFQLQGREIENREEEFSGFIEMLSKAESDSLVAAARSEAARASRKKAFEEALGALESYEKSFSIWPGKISLGEIKGWILNRASAQATAEEEHGK